MSKIFDYIQIDKPNKNVFDLSHEVKLTGNMGQLLPILCEEVMPGDEFVCNTETLVRFMPMLAPVMHRVDVFIHFFYVPNRIIDKNWEEFITGEEIDELKNLLPKMRICDDTTAAYVKGRLPDYMGIPVTDGAIPVQNTIDIIAHPFLAYIKIWNDYYRDQDLQDEVDIDVIVDNLLNDPINNVDDLTMVRNRCWEKDYFTSARPWAQKGDPVELPLGTTAPIVLKDTMTSAVMRSEAGAVLGDGFVKQALGEMEVNGAGVGFPDITGSHETDLANATAVTINDLRKAEALQKWMERNARAGNRYIELLLSQYDVKSSDARVQRAEYLGGGKQPVVISEILNQSPSRSVAEGTEDDLITPVGAQFGHGVSIGKSNSFRKYFEEHGYVIGILSVLPKTSYMSGIHRKFLKTDKFDYPWPAFAQLGEQEVKNIEYFANYYQQTNPNDGTFGYQQRYGEYKYIPSRVCGEFRDTLRHYHLSRIVGMEGLDYIELPPDQIDETVVECNPDTLHRIFAVTDRDEHKLQIQLFNNIKAIRPLPLFNLPSL